MVLLSFGDLMNVSDSSRITHLNYVGVTSCLSHEMHFEGPMFNYVNCLED